MSSIEVTKPKRRRSRKYSAEPVALMPDEAALGPAMLALNEQQRKFVLEYVNGPSLGYGAATRAARAAGINYSAVRVRACQLLHHPKIQSALHEIGGRRVRAAAFAAIANVEAIAKDREHRDCLKACAMLLDRGGFSVETVHTVKVERSPEIIIAATDEIVERIRQAAMRVGLDPLKQIEAVASKPPVDPE